VNLVLLEASENGALLPPTDRRALHISRVLDKGEGEEIDAGLVVEGGFCAAPGSLGRGRIARLDAGGLLLVYRGLSEAPPLLPLRLILGFPRPIQAARILKDLASLGVSDLVLTGTELGEKSYLESNFWKRGEYRRALVEGAEQAANPRLPRVRRAWTLKRALAPEEDEGAKDEPEWERGSRVFLHPGEGRPLLGSLETTSPLTLAIGSERGWSETETGLLEAAGFHGASLGKRILKTETAALAGTILALARLGFM
jgi:RsmE family RNA methyltransferase